MIGNTLTLKEMNTEMVRDVLKSSESVTKNLLSQKTGLSVATCRNILVDLMKTGEVREIELADSTGGRPSKQYVYNADYAHALLVYLRQEGGVPSIFSQVVNAVGEEVSHEYQSYESLGLQELEIVIDGIITKFPKIRVLSLGFPGIVHNGVITFCDIKPFTSVPIVEYLSERYDIPVLAGNDMNITALGSFYRSARDGEESFAYIYYPESGNAGAGIIVNGSVIHGKRNFAGEMANLPGITDIIGQREVQEDPASFASMVSHMVHSIDCIINPAKVVLSGIFFTQPLRAQIVKVIQEDGEPFGAPAIEFEEDIHDSFLHGLKFLALKELSCKYQIVER